LRADEPLYRQLHYRLTTMPARPALLATLAGGVYGALPWSQPTGREIAVLELATSPLAWAVEMGFSIAGWALVGLFFYHAAHQLRLVNHVYSHHTRIDPLNPGPLYALTHVPALNAIAPAPVFFSYYTLAPQVEPAPTPVTLATWLVFLACGAVLFLWPLLGAHALLVQEKSRLQSEAAERMKRVLTALQQTVASGEYRDVAGTTALKNLIESLETEQAMLNRISTWPWQPETPRLLATALLLPIVLLVLDQLIRRLFGP
jgi:hypothetical protein